MNKKIKIISLILLVVILIAGIFVGNTYGFFNRGNSGKYSLKNTATVENSPLSGKTVIFLGSSVTYGYGSNGVSFADYLEKSDGINAIKEAVSGTTLVDVKDNSYVSRMKTIDKNINADAFVCQLSTNDATKEMLLGEISESYDITDLETAAKQAELEAREYDVAAGGGVVNVKINGKKEVLSVKIDPEVVDPDDVETLEDLIVAAVNEAIKTVEGVSAEEMSKITGSMSIPGMF